MEFLVCRAAVSLNNIAVTLMERSEHYSAYDTLKDALVLMTKTEMHQQSFQDKVDRASKFLSRSSRARQSNMPPITVIPISDCPTARILAASSTPGSSSYPLKVYPIRIEAIDSEGILDQDEELLSLIMIYNYGLCLRCVSRAIMGSSHGTRHTLHHDTCIQVLRVASNIVSKFCRDFYCDKAEEAERDAEQTLSISYAVYSAFLQALQESPSSSSEEVEEVLARMTCLNRTLSSLGELSIYPVVKTAAAA